MHILNVTLTIIALLITLNLSVIAQVQTRIDDFPETFRHIKQTWTRPFTGEFEFQEFPAPLKPTTVHFNLRIPIQSNWQDKVDWVIRLLFLKENVSVLSDTLFLWNGPHNPGDVFSGLITFAPRASGFYTITIYREAHENQLLIYRATEGLTFGWCLDESGELKYLGNPQFKTIDCSFVRTNFFVGDSILLQGSAPTRHLFDYQIIIPQRPTLSDTFLITYKLIAKTDLPKGFDLLVDARNVKLISLPKELGNPITEGDELTLQVKAIPLPKQMGQSISLKLFRDYGNKQLNSMSRQTINCSMHFGNQGELVFIDDKRINVPKQYLETSSISDTTRHHEIVVIYKDGSVKVLK